MTSTVFYTLWDQHLNKQCVIDNVSPMAAEDWWNETLNLKSPLYGHTLWWHEGDRDLEAYRVEKYRQARMGRARTNLCKVFMDLRTEEEFNELLSQVKVTIKLNKEPAVLDVFARFRAQQDY